MLLKSRSKSGISQAEPVYLTLKDACELSGHTKQWVKSRVEHGIIHRYDQSGSRHSMYLKGEIEVAMHLSLKEATHPRPAERLLPDYLTLSEVAAALHMTRAYIWRLVRDEKIPAINISGKVGNGADWRIRKEDAEAFISSRPTNMKKE
jgi:excisionase family DNA binding protein